MFIVSILEFIEKEKKTQKIKCENKMSFKIIYSKFVILYIKK